MTDSKAKSRELTQVKKTMTGLGVTGTAMTPALGMMTILGLNGSELTPDSSGNYRPQKKRLLTHLGVKR